jgi:hypothetical protein
VKTAVKDTSKTDKSKIISTLETTETKLQQEIKTHYEAVENITTVQHITDKSEQKVAVEVEKNRHESYKDTIENTAVGASASAAAAAAASASASAAAAIGYHKKNQQYQTTAVPAAFKNIRAIAFDVLETIANYRKTLEQVWKKILTPKNEVVLSGLEFNTFIEDWYGAYIEIKKEYFSQKRPVSDDITLHEALVHILKRCHIKDLLT